MKKKALLTLPAMQVTEDMRRAAGETKRYQYWRSASITGPKYQKYFRVKETEGILEIDVFTWGRIQAGQQGPLYRIFLHDGKYDTWDAEKEKWRTATIAHLMDWWSRTDEERAAYGTYWYRENERKLVIDYTKSDAEDIESAVLQWQQYEKYRGETEIIDAEMSLIPDIPKSFETWAMKTGLNQYMFYESGRKVGLCTACGKYHTLKDPKYGKEGICPGCKRKVTYKTYKKGPKFNDHMPVALIQKMPGGYVFRYFTAYQYIDCGKRKDFSLSECIRITYDRQWKRRAIYSYHRYKTSNKIRWCNGYERIGYYWANGKEEGEARLYPGNLRKVLKGSKLEYSGMLEYAKTGVEFYQQNYIETAREFPGIEKLVKAGFYNLTGTCIDYRNRPPIELYEKKVRKVLGLNGEYFNLIKDKNPMWEEYRTAKECQDEGIRATWEQIQEMAGLGRNFAIYMKYTTPHKMLRYIKENVPVRYDPTGEVTTTSDYHDYLQLAAELKYNLRDKWILYPKNLKERHEQLIEEKREKDLQVQKATDDEKDEMLNKAIKKKSWREYEMETDDLLIRLPNSAYEIRQEGNRQHHCVATYIDRMVQGETCILFIRKKANPDKSYYTVEVKDDVVIQVRGKYNMSPSEDVEEFMEIFKRRIKRAERKAS